MTSQVQISNIALARIGIGQQISALTEQSQEAVTCSLMFDQARDYVLRGMDWPFARKYAALALIEENPNLDWGFSYRYPTDCLFFRRMVTGIRAQTTKPAFEIANSATSRVIFSDRENAIGVYTVRVKDTSFYDPAFVSCLAWRLAYEICSPLAKERRYRNEAMQMYRLELSEAMAEALNEEQTDEEPDSEFIRARD